MILADTSVWIGHLRASNPILFRLLEQGRVLSHPFVIGELSMGNLRQRRELLDALGQIPAATKARDDEVMAFVETHRLHGLGIGYVDAHLLASTRLTVGAKLWTHDRRLAEAAKALDVVFVHSA